MMNLNMLQMFKQNPAQMLSKRFNIPQGMNMNNPNDILQYLMNTNQVSQMQVNQIMSNPMIQQFFNSGKSS